MNDVTNYFDHPAASSSKLKVLLDCPKRYYHLFEKPDVVQEPTEAQSFGTAFHVYVLEGDNVFTEQYFVAPKTRRGTKAYQELEEQAGDKTVIFADDFYKIKGMRDSLFEDKAIAKALKGGKAEHELFLTRS